MNIEKDLRKFKKVYLETEPSQEFLEEGWQDLQGKIAHTEQTRRRFYAFYSRPVVFATMLIFILGSFVGLVGASANSLPGEPLYSLKRLSEDAVSLATGNNLVKVDNRAKEIIKLSEDKKGSSKLQKVVEEYKTAVFEATRSGRNKQEVEEELEQNETEFRQRQGTSSDEYLQKAIETSRKGRGGGESEENKDGNSGNGSDEKNQEQDDRSGSNSGKN